MTHLLFPVHTFALQGSLDLKYLGARFERGKKFVNEYLDTRHRYVEMPLAESHADLLKYQSEQGGGGNTPLASSKVKFWC